MRDDEMFKLLICFLIGWLLCRYMGNGLIIGGEGDPPTKPCQELIKDKQGGCSFYNGCDGQCQYGSAYCAQSNQKCTECGGKYCGTAPPAPPPPPPPCSKPCKVIYTKCDNPIIKNDIIDHILGDVFLKVIYVSAWEVKGIKELFNK